MFYMSYILCKMFASNEKFCHRSQPSTKSYASRIVRMEPSASTPRVFRLTSCAKAVVLRMREDASWVIDCMHCTLYKVGRDDTARVLHDRSTFFYLNNVHPFPLVFFSRYVDISTHNSEMLLPVLLQN